MSFFNNKCGVWRWLTHFAAATDIFSVSPPHKAEQRERRAKLLYRFESSAMSYSPQAKYHTFRKHRYAPLSTSTAPQSSDGILCLAYANPHCTSYPTCTKPYYNIANMSILHVLLLALWKETRYPQVMKEEFAVLLEKYVRIVWKMYARESL